MKTKAKQLRMMNNETSIGRPSSENKRTINVDVCDKNMAPIVDFDVVLTKHSAERSVQRSISEQAIKLAFIYGEEFYKQGLIYYVLGEKNIPELVHPQVRKKCKNLVVIASGDSHEVITVYRSKNPFKHIKRKPKRLRTSRASA